MFQRQTITFGWALCASLAHATTPDEVALEATPEPGEEARTDTNGPISDPVLTLIDAGRGRKQRLQIRAGQGERWQGRLTRASTTTTITDGAEPVVLVPLSTVTAVDLERTGPTQVKVVPQQLDLVGDDANSVGPLVTQLDVLVGLELGLEVSPAQLLHLQLPPLPADLSEPAALVLGDLVNGLQVSTVLLPEEPVGTGARWTVHQPVRQDGLIVDQAWTVTLTRRDGDLLVLELLGVDTLREGEAATMALKGFASSTQGKVWLDLSLPLAKAAELTLTTRATADWTDPEGLAHVTEAEGQVKLSWVTRAAPR